jgi:hypothetical protein
VWLVLEVLDGSSIPLKKSGSTILCLVARLSWLIRGLIRTTVLIHQASDHVYRALNVAAHNLAKECELSVDVVWYGVSLDCIREEICNDEVMII